MLELRVRAVRWDTNQSSRHPKICVGNARIGSVNPLCVEIGIDDDGEDRVIDCGRRSEGKASKNDLTSISVHIICTVSIFRSRS